MRRSSECADASRQAPTDIIVKALGYRIKRYGSQRWGIIVYHTFIHIYNIYAGGGGPSKDDALALNPPPNDRIWQPSDASMLRRV